MRSATLTPTITLTTALAAACDDEPPIGSRSAECTIFDDEMTVDHSIDGA